MTTTATSYIHIMMNIGFAIILLSLASRNFIVEAAFDTFPVKSLNLTSAQVIDMYEVFEHNTFSSMSDPHPVHGTQIVGGTLDGGFAFVGKALRCEACLDTDGFLAVANSSGKLHWMWATGNIGNEYFNAVVQLPNGGDLLIAGAQVLDGVIKRTLTRVNPTAANVASRVKWTASDFGDVSASQGGWEMIDLSADASSIILSGFNRISKVSAENPGTIAFKSYGNVGDGKPVVMSIPISALDTAPTIASATWIKEWNVNG